MSDPTVVHAAHCCKHNCKYGNADCPVVSGVVNQMRDCKDVECDQDVIDKAEAELTHLRAIKSAACAFVYAETPEAHWNNYRALYALLEQTP